MRSFVVDHEPAIASTLACLFVVEFTPAKE
jgi:hypothetical protein